MDDASPETLERRRLRFQKGEKEKQWDAYCVERNEKVEQSKIQEAERERAGKHKNVGTCTTMASYHDRRKRIYFNYLSELEKDPITKEADESRMVTQFDRSAAGKHYLPEDIRTPDTLVMTMNYLIDNIISQDQELKHCQVFVHDRTRAIRTEFEYQSISDPRSISVYEQIARFHIISLHLLLGQNDDMIHNEMEQLQKTLMTLISYYNVARNENVECPNEAEFRSYYLVAYISDPVVRLQIEKLPTSVFLAPILQKALKLCRLASSNNNRPSKRGLENHFASQELIFDFFREISRGSTPYLLACIFESYFPQIRRSAIHSMVYSAKSHITSRYTVDKLADVLGFNNPGECEEFLKQYSVSIVPGSDVADMGSGTGRIAEFRKVVPYTSNAGMKKTCLHYREPKVAPNNIRSTRIIDPKADGMDVMGIIRGNFSIPDANGALGKIGSAVSATFSIPPTPISESSAKSVPQGVPQFAPRQQLFQSPKPKSPLQASFAAPSPQPSVATSMAASSPLSVSKPSGLIPSTIFSPMVQSPIRTPVTSNSPNAPSAITIFGSSKSKAPKSELFPTLNGKPKETALSKPQSIFSTEKPVVPKPEPIQEPEIKKIVWNKPRPLVSITKLSKNIFESMVTDIIESMMGPTVNTHKLQVKAIDQASKIIYSEISDDMVKRITYHVAWTSLNKVFAERQRKKALKRRYLNQWVVAIEREKIKKAMAENNLKEVSQLLASTQFGLLNSSSSTLTKRPSRVNSVYKERRASLLNGKSKVAVNSEKLWSATQLGEYSCHLFDTLWKERYSASVAPETTLNIVVETSSPKDSLESQWLWWHVDKDCTYALAKRFEGEVSSVRFCGHDSPSAWSSVSPTSLVIQIPPLLAGNGNQDADKDVLDSKWGSIRNVLNDNLTFAAKNNAMPPLLLLYVWPESFDCKSTGISINKIKSKLDLDRHYSETGDFHITYLNFQDPSTSLKSGMDWLVGRSALRWLQCTTMFNLVSDGFTKRVKESFSGVDSSILRYKKSNTNNSDYHDKELLEIMIEAASSVLKIESQLLSLFGIVLGPPSLSAISDKLVDSIDAGRIGDLVYELVLSIKKAMDQMVETSPSRNQALSQLQYRVKSMQPAIVSDISGMFPKSLLWAIEKVIIQNAHFERFAIRPNSRVYAVPVETLLRALVEITQRLVERFVVTSRKLVPAGTPSSTKRKPRNSVMMTPSRSLYSDASEKSNGSHVSNNATSNTNVLNTPKRAKLSKQLKGLYSTMLNAKSLLDEA